MKSYPVVLNHSAAIISASRCCLSASPYWTSCVCMLLLACSDGNGKLFEEVDGLLPAAAPVAVPPPAAVKEARAAPLPEPPARAAPDPEQPGDGLPLDEPEPPVESPQPPVVEQPEPVVPRIVAISPPDGATGVTNDATIVITFSEVMDQELTERAYQSESIPSTLVDFAWNDAGTELTIAPRAPLEYATGSDPTAVEARRFSFFMSASAEDLEGHRLEAPQESSFSILRQIESTFFAVQNRDLSGSFRSNDTYGQGQCARGQINMCVGDSGLGGLDEQYRGFMTFDLSSIPADSAVLVGARLSLEITERAGNPFFALGGLFLERTRFDSIGSDAFGSEPLDELGTIATAGNTGTVLDVDVRDAVAVDVGEDGLSQYRLRFEETTDSDGNADAIVSAWDTQSLSVTYLLP
jgi:hypothetical protein